MNFNASRCRAFIKIKLRQLLSCRSDLRSALRSALLSSLWQGPAVQPLQAFSYNASYVPTSIESDPACFPSSKLFVELACSRYDAMSQMSAQVLGCVNPRDCPLTIDLIRGLKDFSKRSKCRYPAMSPVQKLGTSARSAPRSTKVK